MKNKDKSDILAQIFQYPQKKTRVLECVYFQLEYNKGQSSGEFAVFYGAKVASTIIQTISDKAKRSVRFEVHFDEYEIHIIRPLSLVEPHGYWHKSELKEENIINAINSESTNRIFLYRNPYLKALSGFLQDFESIITPTAYESNNSAALCHSMLLKGLKIDSRDIYIKDELNIRTAVIDFNSKNHKVKSYLKQLFSSWLVLQMNSKEIFPSWLTYDNLQHSKPHCNLIYQLLEFGHCGTVRDNDKMIDIDNDSDWLSLFEINSEKELIKKEHDNHPERYDVDNPNKVNSNVNKFWLWEELDTESKRIFNFRIGAYLDMDTIFYKLLQKKYPTDIKGIVGK